MQHKKILAWIALAALMAAGLAPATAADDAASKPNAKPSCTVEGQHQTITRTRARVYANIDGAGKPHDQDGTK